MEPEPLPPLIIDPRPYSTVTVGWSGTWITFVATESLGERSRIAAAVEPAAGRGPIVVRPPGPPIGAKFAGTPEQALMMDVGELGDRVEVLDLADFRYGQFLYSEVVGEGETGVILVDGNVVDLDQVRPLVDAASAGQPVVIRLRRP